MFKEGPKSFIFSFKNKDNLEPFKVPVKEGESAITSSYIFGPIFGVFDFYTSTNPLKETRVTPSSTNFGNSYELPPGYIRDESKTKALLAGTYHFIPSEVEVFYEVKS